MFYLAVGLKMTFVSTETTTCSWSVPPLGDMKDSLSNSGIKPAGSENTGSFVMLDKLHHNLKFVTGNIMKSHILGTNRRNPFMYFLNFW